jgi:predicted TIM-barrel fold metal-dependent hydrolase
MRTYEVVSTDSHLEQPPEYWRPYVDKEFQRFVPYTVTLPNGGQGLLFPGADRVVPLGLQFVTTVGPSRAVEGRWKTAGPTGNRYDAPLVGTGDGVQRLREMDMDEVDADVLFPAVFGGRALSDIPREAHIALCRGYNDWLSQDYTAADHERLWGLALVPPYVGDAIEEMRRVKSLPGIYAVAGWPQVEPEDDRFWEAALDLDMPLTTHGMGVAPAVAWPPPEKAAELNGAVRRGMIGLQFIVSGVLDRLPGLHLFFAETGIGWLPYTYQVIDDLYLRHRLWGDIELPRLPSEYFKQHFHWSFMIDRLGIEHRDDIGIDQIMWSTDFPHMNTDWPESRKIIDDEFIDIPAEDVQKVICDNALTYFKVREAVSA